jgi:NADH:ubiquinone oxidoreductase subunit K
VKNFVNELQSTNFIFESYVYHAFDLSNDLFLKAPLVDGWLSAWNTVGFVLFILGPVGIVCRWKNFLMTMLSIEVMYLGILTSFVLFGVLQRDITAGIYALLLLIFAASESAIGLGLVVYTYRYLHTIGGTQFFILNG